MKRSRRLLAILMTALLVFSSIVPGDMTILTAYAQDLPTETETEQPSSEEESLLPEENSQEDSEISEETNEETDTAINEETKEANLEESNESQNDENIELSVEQENSQIVEESSEIIEENSSNVEEISEPGEENSDSKEESQEPVEESSIPEEDSSEIIEETSLPAEESSVTTDDSSVIVEEESSVVVEESSDLLTPAEEETSIPAEESSTVPTEESSVFTEESSTIIETEKQEEPWSKTLTSTDNKTYLITVKFDNTSGVPADAQLVVTEILPGMQDYDYDEYMSKSAEKTGVEEDSISFARAFDIYLLDPATGDHISPSQNVKVTIELLSETITQNEDEISVIHFEDDTNKTEVIDTELNGEAIEFETDGFSVYVITGFTLERIIEAGDGKTYKVTVTYDDSANLPEDIDLSVKEIDKTDSEFSSYLAQCAEKLGTSVNAFTYARLFDISLVSKSDPNVHYQPETEVTVSIELIDKSDLSSLQVLHITDRSIENMNAAVNGDTLSFHTGSFSIYPIIDDGDEDENARIGYRFWYYNATTSAYEQITTQFFRRKDVTEGGAQIYEPSIPGISESEFIQIFEGWHRGTVSETSAALIDPAVTVMELNQELAENAADSTYPWTEGLIIDIICKLKSAYYITYVDVNANNILSTDLVIKAAEGDTYFTVKTGIKPTRYENRLLGWRLVEEISNPDAELYESGTQYVITGNIILAPVIDGGYWLDFDDNDLVDDGTGRMVSGGASYTAPAFYMNSDDEKQPTVQPDDPVWTGYTFDGWYEDSSCTIPFVFGELLTRNTTIYAKWIPGPSSYRVVIWKQQSTDAVDATDDEKKYDYDFSDLINTGVLTGDLVYLNSSYTNVYGEDGSSTDTDKAYFTFNSEKSDAYVVVKADGTSVLNVYYDRVPMSINFYVYGNGYVYTETTSNDGVQYGIVDGQYVLLDHEDGDEIYSYTYSPTYSSTTGDTGTQYGIIDGEYKELDRTAVATYRPNYIFTATTSTTGTQFGVVNGEFVEVSLGYIATSQETGTLYGLVNGNYLALSKATVYSYTWTHGGLFGSSSYTGTLYFRNGNNYVDSGYTTSTRFIDPLPTTFYRDAWFYAELTGTRGAASSGEVWVDSNGAEYTGQRYFYGWKTANGAQYTGNRYIRTSNSNGAYDYTGARYTRTGNSAPYVYTEVSNDSGTQYGVFTVDNGHVELQRRTERYIYSYNGIEYTGTRYTANNNPTTYSGQRFTLDNGVYHATEMDGSGLYGKDANDVFRPLTVTSSPSKVWSYTDSNGVKHYYTGTRYTRSSNQSRSWQLYKAFTGLYGSTLESNGYTWPTEYNWYETGYGNGGNTNSTSGHSAGTTGGSRMTLKTTFEPLDGEINVKFYGNTATTTGASIRFWKQNEEQTDYILVDTIYVGSNNGGTFRINDKYTGFHAAYYSTNGGVTKTEVDPKGSDGYYGSAVSYTSTGMDVYFDRTEYTLSFFTNNGSNEVIEYKIPYGQDISTYASQSEGQKTGYFFTGWYADAACTSTFDFDTVMPDHGVDVYGRWLMERIRVVVDPGAPNVYMGSQVLTFRLDYDEKIGGALFESATRTGYTLDGWYTDPEFTNKWIFTMPVNSSVEGVDMTYHTAAKWAAARVQYGDDDEEHANVRGILQLYAKWIVNTSEKGVNIIYSAGEAASSSTTVPIDPRLYQDGSDVIVGSAPSGYSDLYIFDYWEAIDRNGNVLTVVDGDGNHITQLAPGTVFNVDSVDAYTTVVDENGEIIVKTIMLRAKYTKSEEIQARYTTITYEGNTFEDSIYPSGSETLRGRARDGSERYSITLDKEINETLALPTADDFYLDGYTLVGWSFIEGSLSEQTDSANLQGNINFTPGQLVAADQLSQNDLNNEDNTLYAMWEPKVYSVTVNQIVEQGVADTSFTYSWKYGIENQLGTSPMGLGSTTLSGNESVTFEDLFEYYGRVGHVFRITAPNVPENKEYAVRISAVVIRDDGTREILDLNSEGNYEILGDVEITFTYSLKVPVTLEKRALNDSSLLTGSSFLLTPVSFNTDTQRWEQVGTVTFPFDMTSASSLTIRLQEGVYKVTETQAPENFAAMSEDLLLTVRKDSAFILRSMSSGAVNESIAKLTGSDSHTLTIYDRPIQTIVIKKEIEGLDLEPNGYVFDVKLTLEGSAITHYDTVGNGVAADITNNAGIIQFSLEKDGTKTLHVPWGSVIEITEREYVQYVTHTESEEDVEDTNTTDGRIFSCTVEKDDTITFINTNVSFTVTKEVTGDFGDKNKFFDFTLSGLVPGRSYRLNLAGVAVTRASDSSGSISFQLKHGQSMIIGLPEHGVYTILEAEDTDYQTSLRVNGGGSELVRSKEVQLSKAVTIVYTNYRPPVAPTGYQSNKKIYVIVLIAGLLLGSMFCLGYKRRNDEEDPEGIQKGGQEK